MITKEQILKMFEEASKKSDYGWSTYQPINAKGYEATLSQSGRVCQDRAEAIIKHIQKTLSKPTFIDWGCNNGYFVFELAKHGYEAMGVDREAKYVNVCQVVNKDSGYLPLPKFFKDELTPLSIGQYRADVALCFSVLHHVKENKIALFNEFSKAYKHAYIEMDGHNYGYDYLRTFYWDLQLVCEANDKYGNGTRLRKTWYCCNETPEATYENIKMENCLGGRGVFKKMMKCNGAKTVIKRENSSFGHTWIKTNLAHEINMYSKYSTNFIPKLISSNVEGDRFMEIEYIDSNVSKGASIGAIFEWLKENKLFIIDINSSQFVKAQNGYVLIDLESIFHVDEVNSVLRKHVELKSYDEQIQYLNGRLK